MPQSIHLAIFYILVILIFSHFVSQTGTERPKLQPTQCNSCKHNVPRVRLAMSLVTVILPISGLTETGQNGPRVLGSPCYLSDFEEGKAAQLRYVLRLKEGKQVTKAMQPRLGRNVSLLLSLIYWRWSAKPSPAPKCMSCCLFWEGRREQAQVWEGWVEAIVIGENVNAELTVRKRRWYPNGKLHH